MNRETCKALLENGVLQSWAAGEVLEYYDSFDHTWKSVFGFEHLDFKLDAKWYRIKPKPKFEAGDWVRYNDVAYEVVHHTERSVVLRATHGSEFVVGQDKCSHVRQVLTPFTFETAVKAIAEKGSSILDRDQSLGEVIGLSIGLITVKTGRTTSPFTVRYEDAAKYIFASDNSPFAQVTYEDIQ
jgi:hypothetical protein